MRVIGWDIGGAHVKAALLRDGAAEAVLQVACPLWLGLDRLVRALAELRAALGDADLHAVTMTGELADIFPGRAAGVATIAAVFREEWGAGPAYAYRPAGFVTLDQAASHAAEIASANWHATAALAARFWPDGLVVDMGSTTTDIVPLGGGAPCPAGFTDAARLAAGELVYTGLVRTAVMAVADRAPFAGAWTRLAAEYFATMADVHRVLGTLPGGADLMPTADGRDKTRAASVARLARMVGHDAADATDGAWVALADWFAQAQLRAISDAAALVQSRVMLPRAAPVIVAGAGEPVIRRWATLCASGAGRPCISFTEIPLPGGAAREALSRCAPAVAVAVLALASC